jgi:hypothetical protein
MTSTAALLTTFALALGLTGCGPSSGGAADGARADAGATAACAPIAESMPTICSMAAPPRNAIFTNNCAVPIDIWWVNFQCGETFYHRLDPGQSYTQASFVTHPWRARTVPAGVPMGSAKGMLIKDFGAIPAGADDLNFAVP